MNDVFARLPTLKNLAKAAGGLVGLILACAGLCSCDSTRSENTQLETVLHTRPADHQLFASSQITNAIQAFGKDRAAAFAVLKAASNETNTFLVQDGRTIDTNRFVRAGALYGMGQLGKAVPEATPFLWGVIYSPSRNSLDRWMAFNALKQIGFEVPDIPTLAKLLPASACNQNILTMLVPETISGLIESNPPAARPNLFSVENLLDDSSPDTQFRAALALVKSEGADNPKIYSPLHALFQRSNSRTNEYYKSLAVKILGAAGPPAKTLVPDLLEFARLPGEEYTYQVIAKITPELGSTVPEVAQALREQHREQMWAEKWKSGTYTFEDLRTALTDPVQVLTAVNYLAQMGAAAKTAVPDMIKALWGKDEETRNKILADIYRLDSQATITKVYLVKDHQVEPVNGGLQFAYSVLEREPASPQNKILTDTCFQMFFTAGWVLPDELATLTNSLAQQAPKAYQAYLDGLKPPVCSKPVGSNAVIFKSEVQPNSKIK